MAKKKEQTGEHTLGWANADTVLEYDSIWFFRKKNDSTIYKIIFYSGKYSHFSRVYKNNVLLSANDGYKIIEDSQRWGGDYVPFHTKKEAMEYKFPRPGFDSPKVEQPKASDGPTRTYRPKASNSAFASSYVPNPASPSTKAKKTPASTVADRPNERPEIDLTADELLVMFNAAAVWQGYRTNQEIKKFFNSFQTEDEMQQYVWMYVNAGLKNGYGINNVQMLPKMSILKKLYQQGKISKRKFHDYEFMLTKAEKARSLFSKAGAAIGDAGSGVARGTLYGISATGGALDRGVSRMVRGSSIITNAYKGTKAIARMGMGIAGHALNLAGTLGKGALSGAKAAYRWNRGLDAGAVNQADAAKKFDSPEVKEQTGILRKIAEILANKNKRDANKDKKDDERALDSGHDLKDVTKHADGAKIEKTLEKKDGIFGKILKGLSGIFASVVKSMFTDIRDMFGRGAKKLIEELGSLFSAISKAMMINRGMGLSGDMLDHMGRRGGGVGGPAGGSAKSKRGVFDKLSKVVKKLGVRGVIGLGARGLVRSVAGLLGGPVGEGIALGLTAAELYSLFKDADEGDNETTAASSEVGLPEVVPTGNEQLDNAYEADKESSQNSYTASLAKYQNMMLNAKTPADRQAANEFMKRAAATNAETLSAVTKKRSDILQVSEAEITKRVSSDAQERAAAQQTINNITHNNNSSGGDTESTSELNRYLMSMYGSSSIGGRVFG